MVTFESIPISKEFVLPGENSEFNADLIKWTKVGPLQARQGGKVFSFEAETLVHLLPIPNLIAMQGLPGSGKSTVARGLAEMSGAVIIESDAIRAKLGLALPDVFEPDANDWEADTWRVFHRIVREMAALMLAQRKDVIYDATNCSQIAIDQLEQLAWHEGARLTFHPVAVPSTVEWLRRLALRPEGAAYWVAVIEKMKKGIPEELYERLGL